MGTHQGCRGRAMWPVSAVMVPVSVSMSSMPVSSVPPWSVSSWRGSAAVVPPSALVTVAVVISAALVVAVKVTVRSEPGISRKLMQHRNFILFLLFWAADQIRGLEKGHSVSRRHLAFFVQSEWNDKDERTSWWTPAHRRSSRIGPHRAPGWTCHARAAVCSRRTALCANYCKTKENFGIETKHKNIGKEASDPGKSSEGRCCSGNAGSTLNPNPEESAIIQ